MSNDNESYSAYMKRKLAEIKKPSSSIITTKEEYYGVPEDEYLAKITEVESEDGMAMAEATSINVDLDLNSYSALISDEHKERITIKFDEPVVLGEAGMKFDTGKPDYSLLPFAALDEVVKVLTYGAAKYDRFNWEKIEAFRYEASTMRHISAHMQGEKLDSESGISHLAHAVCGLLYLLDFEVKGKT